VTTQLERDQAAVCGFAAGELVRQLAALEPPINGSANVALTLGDARIETEARYTFTRSDGLASTISVGGHLVWRSGLSGLVPSIVLLMQDWYQRRDQRATGHGVATSEAST
jgi:hypothetical protein